MDIYDRLSNEMDSTTDYKAYRALLPSSEVGPESLPCIPSIGVLLAVLFHLLRCEIRASFHSAGLACYL